MSIVGGFMRAFLFLALAGSLAAAQTDSPNGGTNSPIRVCIATPTNRSHLTISPDVQRNRLVHFINTSAQKKNAKVRVEAVSVDATEFRDVSAAAEDQSCRYFVLSEFDMNKSYIGGTTAGMGGLDPMIKNGSANTHRASLSFRVLRSAGNTNIDSGLITMATANDEDSA